jgi:hypothetical protein
MRVCLLTVLLCMGRWSAPWTLAAEKPQYGGILQVVVAGDLPSLDMHQEATFMVVHPMRPMYNTLISGTRRKRPGWSPSRPWPRRWGGPVLRDQVPVETATAYG